MRGYVPAQLNFVLLINVETLLAPDHPLRVGKRMRDEALRGMSAHFDDIYAAAGAPSIPPETLLKAKVLQALYTVPSDRRTAQPGLSAPERGRRQGVSHRRIRAGVVRATHRRVSRVQGGRETLRVHCTAAYAASQKVRKRIEELFGWGKTTGCFRQSRYRGVARTHAAAQFVFAACNLVRMARLWVTSPPPAARA